MSEEERERLSRRDFARLTGIGLGAFALSDVLVRVFAIRPVEAEDCCTVCYNVCEPCDGCDSCETCEESCEEDCTVAFDEPEGCRDGDL